MWVLFAFGSALFAGVTAILAKVGVKNVDSTLATALRTVVVLLFAWVMVLVVGSGGTMGELDRRTLLFLGLSGLATGASWLCYFRALQLGDVNKVTPVDKTSTVLTMVLAMVFLGEAFTWLKLLCIVLILGGTFLMLEKKPVAEAAAPPGAGEPGRAGARRDGRWLLYAVGSAVFASLTAILGKVGIQNVESSLGTALRTVVVLVMAWAIALARGKHREIGRIDKKSWVFLIFSGFATGLSWLCYYRALQEGPASVVVPIDKLSIVVTVVFAWIVFKERLRARALMGLALLVAGTLLLVL